MPLGSLTVSQLIVERGDNNFLFRVDKKLLVVITVLHECTVGLYHPVAFNSLPSPSRLLKAMFDKYTNIQNDLFC